MSCRPRTSFACWIRSRSHKARVPAADLPSTVQDFTGSLTTDTPYLSILGLHGERVGGRHTMKLRCRQCVSCDKDLNQVNELEEVALDPGGNVHYIDQLFTARRRNWRLGLLANRCYQDYLVSIRDDDSGFSTLSNFLFPRYVSLCAEG